MPRFTITSYDISSDGKKVVFAAIDDSDDKSRLWLASVDRRSAPLRLSPGHERAVYAYRRQTVQRHLYKVHLP